MPNTHSLKLALVGGAIGIVATFAAMRVLGYTRETPAHDSTADVGGVSRPPTPLPGQSSADLTIVVAELDGGRTRITVGQLQHALNAQSAALRTRYTDPEKQKTFLTNMIRFEVQVAEARRRHLETDPDVVHTADEVMVKRLTNDVEREVKPESVTDAEMHAYYDQHLLEYNTPEKVRASVIVLKDKALVDQVTKAVKGADMQAFRELVTKYSVDDATKQHGGDLQYFALDATVAPREVVAAAFTLVRTGDISEPIQTKDALYIIQQTGRMPARARTFDDVRPVLQQLLYRDKRTKALEDFVTGLVTKSNVKLHEAALTKVKIDTSPDASVQSPTEL